MSLPDFIACESIKYLQYKNILGTFNNKPRFYNFVFYLWVTFFVLLMGSKGSFINDVPQIWTFSNPLPLPPLSTKMYILLTSLYLVSQLY